MSARADAVPPELIAHLLWCSHATAVSPAALAAAGPIDFFDLSQNARALLAAARKLGCMDAIHEMRAAEVRANGGLLNV